jgi:hypothetical protein
VSAEAVTSNSLISLLHSKQSHSFALAFVSLWRGLFVSLDAGTLNANAFSIEID